MSIPEEILNGLTTLAKTQFAQQNFDKLAKCAFMNLAGDENNIKAIEQLGNESQTFELFNHILLFTVQCMKLQLMEIEISAYLQNCGIEQTINDAYIKKYNQFMDFINDPENTNIAINFESKIGFKYLVDVDWQQEIVVSSKYANKVYQEIYKIQLHTKDQESKDETINFKCTLPQLIEINNKLNVMVKNIEQTNEQYK